MGPSVDKKTGAQLGIGIVHAKAHEKKLYSVCNRFPSVANVAYATILIVNDGEDELHLTFSGAGDGKALAFLLTGATAATDGTRLVPYNRIIGADTYGGARFYAGGTVTNTGKAEFCGLLGSGRGPQSIGANLSERDEFIIDPGVSVVAALQCTAGAVKDFVLSSTFYPLKEE